MGLFNAPSVEKLKARRDIPELIRALTYAHVPSEREAAAVALGEIRDVRAVGPLAASLEGDSYEGARHASLIALCRIATVEAQEALARALKAGDGTVRVMAAHALGTMHGPSAVRPLAAVTRDEDPRVRDAAIAALMLMGADAITCLVADLRSYEFRESASAALVLFGQPAVEPIVSYLDSIGWDERWYSRAKETLVGIGQPAIEPLVARLTAKEWKVRWEISSTLEAIGWQPEGTEVEGTEAEGAYWTGRNEWDKCAALGPAGIDHLVSVLPDKRAVLALAKVGDVRAIEPLIADLTSEFFDERQAAARALVNMYPGLKDEERARVLAQRPVIIQPHVVRYHTIYSDDVAYDDDTHEGIGVDFPI